jgi:serine-type anaerobic sulfatase-maturating enzyme
MSKKPESFDARVMAGASLMIKPVGAACNLDCAYCYYLEVQDNVYGGHAQRMSLETLETTLREYIASAPDTATICWQGGEPTLAGLAFFEKAVEIQKSSQRPGQRIVHALQTNGTILDDDWCRFFKREKFLVGISIDGGPPLHDTYRVDAAGHKTHAKVMRGLKLLRKHGVEHNILCVLHRENVKHPRHLFEYLVGLGEKWLQFIPAIEWVTDEATGGPSLAPFSPRPDDYGRFLCETFDLWFDKYRDKVSVRDIDTALQSLVSGEASLCIYSGSCHRQLTIEANGDVFGCDHFVEPRWRIGHINRQGNGSCGSPSTVPLTIAATPNPDDAPKGAWPTRVDYDTLSTFADRKLSVPQTCLDCEYLRLCHGGCPKDRPHRGDVPAASILCEGYKMFFSHAMLRMQWLAEYLRHGTQPPRLD